MIVKYKFYLIILVYLLILNINLSVVWANINKSKCSTTFSINNQIPLYKEDFLQFNYAASITNVNYTLKLKAIGEYNNFNPYSIVGLLPKDYTLLYLDSLMITPLDDINTLYPLIADNICISKLVPSKDNYFSKIKLTININKLATWHNNTAITSADLLFTLSKISTDSWAYYKELLQNITHISIINPTTLEIYFSHYQENTISLILSIPILSYTYWHNIGFTKPYTNIPLGSGPYTITVNKGNITYTKNQQYWAQNLPSRKGMFTFSNINIEYYKTLLTVGSSLNNTYDFEEIAPIDAVMPSTIERLQKNNLNIVKIKDPFNKPFSAMFFNVQSNYLNILQVRKAIFMLYNFSKINQNIYNNKFTLQSSLFTNSTSTTLQNSNYTTAKTLLDSYYIKYPTLTIVFTKSADIMSDWLHNLQQAGFKLKIIIANQYIYNLYLRNKNYDIIEGNLLFANPPQFELKQYFTNPKDSSYNLNNINYSLDNKSIDTINNELFENYLFLPLPISEYNYYAVKNNILPNQYGINNHIINLYNWTTK